MLNIFKTSLLLSSLFFFLTACDQPAEQSADNTPMLVTEAMNEPNLENYARALTPRPFIFPADHADHPNFRTEWWYATGNLWTETGRRFGYQLTLFRIAQSPDALEQDSTWRTRQIYMGHLGFSDIDAQQHYARQRFSRAAVGLAGVEAKPLKVWLEDWQFAGQENGDLLPLKIQAGDTDFALDFSLDSDKPIVLQGDRGLSQKSAKAGNASYYYSLTRLKTQGTIHVGDQTFDVTGNSWLDREWSSSALGDDQTGWDWFALQLDDGRDLMFYRLRHRDGGMHPLSKGVLVQADGSYRRVDAAEVELEELQTWQSPTTQNRYVIGWRLQLPQEQLDLTVSAAFAEQEMDLFVNYWEGAVDVAGSATGSGYLEMTARQ